MSRSTLAQGVALVAAIVVTAASAEEAPRAAVEYAYTVEQLPLIGASAYGINNRGQVGGSVSQGGAQAGFITGPRRKKVHTFLPDEYLQSSVQGINERGAAAGLACQPSVPCTGFTIGPQRREVRMLAEHYGGSNAKAINGAGQVVGWYDVPSQDRSQAFITGPLGKGMLDITGIPNRSSRAHTVNDRGRVAGIYADLDKRSWAFITNDQGLMEQVGAYRTVPMGMNESGQLVGYEGSRAFISGPDGKDIRYLQSIDDAVTTWLVSVNEAGQAVGWEAAWFDGVYYSRAIVTNQAGTQLFRLDTLAPLPEGVMLSDAQSINDLGQIVANGSNNRIYVLTPTRTLD